MKKQETFGIIIILSIVVIAGFSIWKAISWITSADVGLTGAIVTAAAGILGLIYSQLHSKNREISEGHRPKKIEVYNTFFDITEKFVYEDERVNIDGKIAPEIQKMFQELNRGMIIWASPGVIQAWLSFRRKAGKTDANTLLLVDEVLKAIRKDLGNSNWNLAKGDLVRILLKDPDELKS